MTWVKSGINKSKSYLRIWSNNCKTIWQLCIYVSGFDYKMCYKHLHLVKTNLFIGKVFSRIFCSEPKSQNLPVL